MGVVSLGGSRDSPRPSCKLRHALHSRREGVICHRIGGIDVHKRTLDVMVADIEVAGEYAVSQNAIS
jgi:hypothetical protein